MQEYGKANEVEEKPEVPATSEQGLLKIVATRFSGLAFNIGDTDAGAYQ